MPSNIVEGCRTARALQFARYLQDSINSANEVEWRLQVARDLELITQKEWVALSNEIVEIRKMTYGYRKKVLGNMDPPADPSPPQPRRREKESGASISTPRSSNHARALIASV